MHIECIHKFTIPPIKIHVFNKMYNLHELLVTTSKHDDERTIRKDKIQYLTTAAAVFYTSLCEEWVVTA